MTRKYKSKNINDGIHGLMVIPALVIAIIDTPQFQRLRRLLQTGCGHMVYPSARHTRKEHSIGEIFDQTSKEKYNFFFFMFFFRQIGVGHLAALYGQLLQKKFPHLNITDIDILCLQIAGTCHDLGHGPESHLYEKYVHECHPELHWTHEETSILMFRHLIKSNGLTKILREHGIDKVDETFIEELIGGPLDNVTRLPFKSKFEIDAENWPYKGRPKEKSFLYEIVANKVSGIDVDKWDYLIRDASNFNIKARYFDYERYMQYSKVVMGRNGLLTIGIPIKEKELVEVVISVMKFSPFYVS